MLSKKIVDGCEFIVFDLEWNQPIPGKTYDFDCAALDAADADAVAEHMPGDLFPGGRG